MHEIEITLQDVLAAGSVPAAIGRWCEESDTASSGVIGPSFATSGPGSGWTMEYDEEEYSLRAFRQGAVHYVDSTTGQMRSIREACEDDSEDDIIYDIGGGCGIDEGWTDDSVVCLVVPDMEESMQHPEIVTMMAKAVIDHHGYYSDKRGWAELMEGLKHEGVVLGIDGDQLDP